MTSNENFSESENQGISRRTVVKGAAWAVPVIALASATPAFASSPVVPEPGDHCYQGGQAVNAFRFYTLQPTMVGDTFTLSGPALLSSSTVTGVGISVSLTSETASPYTRTYTVTAVDASVTYPYLLIAGTNSTGNAENRMLTVSQEQQGQTSSWTKEFVSSTTNCQLFDK